MAEFRHLVRIANTDLKGEKQLAYALNYVKGIGVPLSLAICKVANLSPSMKTGDISNEQVDRLDEIIKTPLKFGIPVWMVNRRKDPESGEDTHLVTNNLIFVKGNDIKFMRRIRSYKGVRHSLGQPVRGQRTKSNFRKNKGKVMGVKTSGKKRA
ncbi:30S ribosomal protein S13 [Candidatus Woesearchaeota archaeon CG10_big_fil_rev_8_21_14_0_10_37_12]|nr:MAG: 30S ribosomal protein S13 [Candidatus Woesearchaeota archaeon CG10_big_fil_rev_8_21_14_0_10_37_12]